jgi:RHS repeat-associated protein
MADPSNPLSLVDSTDTIALYDLRNINQISYINSISTFTIVYSSATRTFTDSTPAGRTSTSVIDAQERVIQQQTPGLNLVTFTYDSHGRLSQTQQGSGPLARSTVFSYNSGGLLDTVTDALNRPTVFAYDSAGRVTQETLPGNRVVGYTYDKNGNVTSIVPPGQPAHGFTYTPVDLTSQYTPPSVSTTLPQTTYAYNTDRQPTLITRPDGQTINFNYDFAGRVSTVTLPTGSITYAYNGGTGHLASILAPSGETQTYGFDGSLLTGATWFGPISGSITTMYDGLFRVSSQTVDGSNLINYSYDPDSLLTQAGTLSLSRSPQNGLLTASFLGSVSDAWTYNGFAEPAGYTASISNTPAYSVQYQRDNLGRITQKTETIGGITTTYGYSYDTAGRLSGVTTNGSTTGTYTYDGNGNRITGTSPTIGSQSCTYDAQDRLTACGSTTYAYSANGELTKKVAGSQITQYDYDDLGNLLFVTLSTDTAIDYVVDGQNRRVGKKINGTLVQGFLYDGQLRIAAELDGANNLVSRFVYGSRLNVPDYMVKGGVTYRIVTDQLGSPRLVINSITGQITQRMDYDEFGNVTNDTNPGFQPFGFAGGLYDQDTKLVRFGARDYDAGVGRWTAKDLVLFHGRDTNLYGYVLNDSINGLDLSGLWKITLGADVGFAFENVYFNFGYDSCQGFIHTIDPNVTTSILGADLNLTWNWRDIQGSTLTTAYGPSKYTSVGINQDLSNGAISGVSSAWGIGIGIPGINWSLADPPEVRKCACKNQ